MLHSGPSARPRAGAPARYRSGRAAMGAACLGLVGCARPVMPEPRDAVAEYADAARRGDADALYAMLTDAGRRELGLAGTRALVKGSRAELARSAASLSSPEASVRARARVRFDDGEVAELELERGAFRIGSAAALPAGARTPVEAVAGLRQALARRSYAALVRVLTPETRAALERDLDGLVEGLEHPDRLEIEVKGDAAEVRVPGGHSVKLKREAGAWRIDDFD
ncbi:MAG: hypothetical protein OZ921_15720 [Sorangiineae bacterium]|nr:hypothetical protein [Polyangiaceae bacterium]MEB2323960.1 hypothetical protein [Sorangiineae bacterium]